MPDSERRVLDVLRTLDEAWCVYHGVRIVARPSGGKPAKEKEIDFLLLHREHGMLVLEVKGGGVDYVGREEGFTSVGRDGVRHRVVDPFWQASDSLHVLKDEIAARPGWTENGVDFVHGHGVVFPDCLWRPRVPGPAMPAEIVIDREQLTGGGIEKRLLALFDFWKEGRSGSVPIGKTRLKRLHQHVLAPHFALMPSLGDMMAWDERALIRLSDEQESVLDFLERNPRSIVEGCSGSGKTLIAMEHVRRLAAEGRSVLFLCFNRILGENLREATGRLKGLSGRLTAGTFHDFCRETWEGAGHAWTGEPERGLQGEDVAAFWLEESARRLSQAAGELGLRFDALVVDEAQDFERGWWGPLRGLLADPGSSAVALFLDPEQDLWSRRSDFGERLPVFPIRSNRRSTRAIAEFASRLVGIRVRHPWGVPDGEWPVVSRWRDEEEELRLVEGKVQHLVTAEKLDLSRIAIVGLHSWRNSFLNRAGRVWEIPVDAVDDHGKTAIPGAIRYATPHRFKGLEADVVLLVDVDGDVDRCRPRSLYVAASRARHRLFVYAKSGVELPEAPG